MNLLPIAAVVAGAIGAPVVDHFKPEWGREVAGRHVEPGAFASLAALGLGLLFKMPALALLGAAGGVVEIGKVTSQTLLASAPPGGGQLPSGGGSVSGVDYVGSFGYGALAANPGMLNQALADLDGYLR